MDRVALFDLLAHAEQTLAGVDRLRTDIGTRVNAVIDGRVLAALEATDVEELRPYFPKGTRLGALTSSRFRTAADIYRSSPGALAALPGIGPQSAQAIHDAARAKADEERAVIRFRLDPDRRTDHDAWLLVQLQALQRVDGMSFRLRQWVMSVRARADPLAEDARRSESRLRMFFSGAKKRQAALAAAAMLDRIAADPAVAGIGTLVIAIDQAVATPAPPVEQVWTSYQRDAAALNGLLSQFISTPTDLEARHGYVGTTIAAGAEAVRLDTSGLKARLRGYQEFGAQYALSRQRVILGDEMGLGKTVQALAVAAHLAATEDVRHFLVICPASVVVNWANESRKHSHLRPYEVVGPARDAEIETWAAHGGVAITTYGTAKSIVLPRRPGMFIVDEAHYLKNPGAQRSQALRGLLRADDRVLFLTGTPMENRLEEFRNLVRYLQPAVAARLDVDGVRQGPTAFRRAVAPAYLRRNQIDVLTELPDLIETEEWVRLGRADAAAYRESVASGNFMAIRQSPYFAGPRSAKLERLVEIVEEAEDSGAKVIVFSYFLKVLDTIRDALPGRVFGPLTGAMSGAGRQALVDDFTTCAGSAVLLAQIEAGGVGLNIQAASVVVITEPQWKPSTESQAIARAHRMGQLRTVQVHRILAKDSIDEPMREMLLRKARLFDEYARESYAKDANPDAMDASWTVRTAEDLVRVEQARLGVGVPTSPR